MRRLLWLHGLAVVLVVAMAVPAFGAKGTPLVATFQPLTTATGVTHDGNPVYTHGVDSVQCYFGVAGKDVDLVTYNTPRSLLFVFDPSNAAFQASGITTYNGGLSTFNAENDLFGINYWGPYQNMTIGTTAQVQMDLEFYVGRITYEIDYSSLAVMRLSADTWLVTSDPNDIPGFPGFTASSTGSLNVIRRKSVTKFGPVSMPIRFEVKLK